MGMQFTRRNFLQGTAVAVSAIALAGCGNSNDGSGASSDADSGTVSGDTSGDAFKLGGIGPLTGGAAIYGTACKYGAQVAVDELNAAGGAQLELNFQDDEHNPEKSVNAYNTLKDWGMQVLIGTTTTGPCVSVSKEANADNIFEITPSASSTDVIGGQPDTDGNITEQRKGNVFQMCFTDPNQGTASAEYIKDKNLGTKIAVIYNNSDAYSKGIYIKFKAEAAKLGLDIVSETSFTDDSATDFKTQLNDAKDKGADLVFLPIYYQPASLILKQAKDMGYAPKFFGVDGMDGILGLEGFDTSLAEGVMLLTPFVATADDEKTKKFVEEYKKVSGSDENPNQFAADAYDCVCVVKQALENAECTPDMSASDICDKLVAAITAPDFKYSGLTGEDMTWTDSGEVTKTPKGMIIQSGQYQPLD
ncbi:ABC transporter substrate-binding protein [Olsenella sp. YH-ols2217]|uniref:ABC transporter substrate-binding protein n=1 Tax=Kribbibacterium absianum TaxID=3044210 RepID=A0ABT6ZMA9_9ACTN|nr:MULTISPECIES: ABC transporter substrate-binding protein [unclassified Olsenella]MDJ1122185.1 ABC transporter substrate-binding protein [Olsenella sp. YH-ols2216]MDJ1130193.1 ABC transporter substrate-binding protein [Olsenella sp. YH-ols2217]